MDTEERERIEENCAKELDDHARAIMYLIPAWLEKSPMYPDAAYMVLKITVQAEVLRYAASNLRRPKWIRMEREQYEADRAPAPPIKG